MVMLFAGDSHKTALQMSDGEVGKRLTAYTYKKTLKDQKGDTPKGDTPKGEKPNRGRGAKRNIEGKEIPSQSSTDKTTEVVQAPVDCNMCGGSHPYATVQQWKDKFVCPFVYYGHPQVNTDAKVPFLDSKEGKPYKDHPWNQTDSDTKVTTTQHRLKMKQQLVDGKYEDLPESGKTSRVDKGKLDPKGFLANIADQNDNPYNPYMTLTVPTLRSQRRQGRKGQEGK
jgi:hypothetical protein